jgi:hypothetical protein
MRLTNRVAVFTGAASGIGRGGALPSQRPNLVSIEGELLTSAVVQESGHP